MPQQNDYFADIYQKLNTWLTEVKVQQKPNIDEFIKQAKLYAGAAEAMTEEKLQQFTDNLKYDLHDFYQLNKSQAKHSVYLGLLNEALWENLGKLTDKSQVEWAELVDDFNHDGVYKSGDYIGFGELQCEQCDEKLTITHFSEIGTCANCGATDFIRLPLKP
ncbi:zinc ribbon-containing protein [Colwellia echini]|uniref:Zinc ribbon-containing protein n=1 Tax=Colwellia echini TaxID=1982103 RepID=A0ABY3MTA8_9GAMM|nr:zinc ribbon-containing protein [Colwellia echini]TYK64362.1 hypothetical protein CWS31_015975 [Colwellia echini]